MRPGAIAVGVLCLLAVKGDNSYSDEYYGGYDSSWNSYSRPQNPNPDAPRPTGLATVNIISVNQNER